jgi:hypothetical protein
LLKILSACLPVYTRTYINTNPRTDRPADTARRHNGGTKAIFVFILSSLNMRTWSETYSLQYLSRCLLNLFLICLYLTKYNTRINPTRYVFYIIFILPTNVDNIKFILAVMRIFISCSFRPKFW